MVLVTPAPAPEPMSLMAKATPNAPATTFSFLPASAVLMPRHAAGVGVDTGGIRRMKSIDLPSPDRGTIHHGRGREIDLIDADRAGETELASTCGQAYGHQSASLFVSGPLSVGIDL